MIAKWSPTDSSLVIVDNYNIYYIPTVAKPNNVKQITFNGSEDFYNGIPDWVYTGKYIYLQLMTFNLIYFARKNNNLNL